MSTLVRRSSGIYPSETDIPGIDLIETDSSGVYLIETDSSGVYLLETDSSGIYPSKEDSSGICFSEVQFRYYPSKTHISDANASETDISGA